MPKASVKNKPPQLDLKLHKNWTNTLAIHKKYTSIWTDPNLRRYN